MKGPYAMFSDDELARIEALLQRRGATGDMKTHALDDSIQAKIDAVWNSAYSTRRPSDEKIAGHLTIGSQR